MYDSCIVMFASVFFAVTFPEPNSMMFPYTTLFRSDLDAAGCPMPFKHRFSGAVCSFGRTAVAKGPFRRQRVNKARARKSTRLNSSHITTTYAAFCLKKKLDHHTTT